MPWGSALKYGKAMLTSTTKPLFSVLIIIIIIILGGVILVQAVYAR
jgi:hypothetical protein